MTQTTTAINTFASLDVNSLRQDFPVLKRQVHGQPLVYLDNAATTQKPKIVIDTVDDFYTRYNANVHRGVHTLSQEATIAYENARETIAKFINAASAQEIVFTRGTTESINLVAQSYGRKQLKPGDEIIISHMEHHSNIVPWQLLCEQTGAILKVIPINAVGELLLEDYAKLLSQKTKIVAIGHISNALGSINPIKQIIQMAHDYHAKVLIDGAQAAPHTAIDVQALDCDFYAFSGHKAYGPTGIGALYAKADLLNAMPPYQGGGEMIKMVSFNKTIYNDIPHKFEAGTPNIAGAIGFAKAVEYIQDIGLTAMAAYEKELLEYATARMKQIAKIRLIGEAQHKASIISFLFEDVHAHDVATILDHQGIAVRAGHHCAMPVMEFYNITASARASFAFYNTTDEIDQLIHGIHKVIEVLGG